jgi:hypothetical protein
LSVERSGVEARRKRRSELGGNAPPQSHDRRDRQARALLIGMICFWKRKNYLFVHYCVQGASICSVKVAASYFEGNAETLPLLQNEKWWKVVNNLLIRIHDRLPVNLLQIIFLDSLH